MVIIAIRGGLGNQMFQYALGRMVSIKNDERLFLETGFLETDFQVRYYSLKSLNIKSSLITNKYLKKIVKSNTKLNRLFIKYKLLQEIDEGEFIFQSDIYKTIKPITLYRGYWQTSKYFNEIREQLLEEFTPIEIPEYPDWIMQENVVAVGVRRTDYLTDTKYGFIGLEYYQKAFQYIKERVDNPLFVIFSDDVEWCKQNFKSERIHFIEEPEWSKDYLKVHLMSKCAHHIVSNSTFYWWGAWLNTNPNQIVTRPSHPFNDMKMLYQYHYPDHWTIIDN